MVKLATICYIDNGKEILLLHRNKKPNDIHAGKWIGVGGKLEKDLEFSIEGEERHILEIRKAKETPNKYPRKVGTPNKKPLY